MAKQPQAAERARELEIAALRLDCEALEKAEHALNLMADSDADPDVAARLRVYAVGMGERRHNLAALIRHRLTEETP